MARSEYSKHIDDLLDIHNSVNKYDEIIENINSLYNDTVNKKIRLINQTDKTIDYYNFQSRVPLRFIKEMYTKDNITNSYTGYNKVSIASTSTDPEKLLDSIEDYYTYIYLNLKNIRREVIKDLYTYQRMNRLYSNFSHDDLNILADNNLFKYFNHHNKYDYSLEREQSLVTSLILFLIIQPVYLESFKSILIDFRFRCYSTSTIDDVNITDEELNLTENSVYDSFENFAVTNNDNISDKIAEYLIGNIFVLNDPSDIFKEDMSIILNSFILNMATKFREFEISKSYHQTIAGKTITNLVDYITINNIKDRKEYITISQEEDIILDENYIFQKFNEILTTTQILNIISLEYIVSQFKDYPLYFLNSYFITYNNYLNDIMQNEEFVENITEFISMDDELTSEHVPNITGWFSQVNIDPTEFVTNRDSIDIDQLFIDSKALEHAFTVYFTEVINNFIDSEEFHEMIVIDLPNEIKEVSNYISEYRNLIINNVGRIKSFIKILLIKEMTDGNLFNDLFILFESAFNDSLKDYTEVNIPDIVDSIKSPGKAIQKTQLKFAQGMFYSAHVSGILNGILGNYRI